MRAGGSSRRRRPRRVLVPLVALGIAALAFATAEVVQLVDLRAYRGLAPICRVMTPEKAIALSFDDGPDPKLTSEVVRLLEANGDRATFFVIGRHARAHPDLIELVSNTGMEIGNHTWSHPHLDDLSVSEATSESRRTATFLSSISVNAPLFRAPFGEISADTLRVIESTGLTPVHWSLPVDGYLEGEGLDPADAADAIARAVRPGEIVLAHDARDGAIIRASTVATLRLLLPELESPGFRVVTVGRLLQLGAPIRAEPRPWFWQSGFTCP
jgi:peptidoglycan-N-acetylglucosamine deacetylase